jgi:hypothetical protein
VTKVTICCLAEAGANHGADVGHHALAATDEAGIRDQGDADCPHNIRFERKEARDVDVIEASLNLGNPGRRCERGTLNDCERLANHTSRADEDEQKRGEAKIDVYLQRRAPVHGVANGAGKLV